MNEVEIVGHSQMNGLNIFFNTLDYRIPHIHADFELMWIMENSMTAQFVQREEQVSPGDVLLFSPHQLHGFYKSEKSCTFLCFQISAELPRQFFPEISKVFFDEMILNRCLSKQSLLQLKGDLFRAAELYLSCPKGYRVGCGGWMNVVFYRLLSEVPWHLISEEEDFGQKKKNDRLHRLLKFVDGNYMHKIQLSDFAVQEGVTMGYLSHFVKGMLHQSFQEYVETARFNCACKLIEAGEQKMLDVCFASGFSDYRYFSRAFVQRTGKTPEEYRKMPRQENSNIAKTHHSLHSLEHFYDTEVSLQMLKKYAEKQEG